MSLPAVANMPLPAIRLLLRRQDARNAEAGFLALRIATVGARGDAKAMRDLCNDLTKMTGRKPEDTPFKRLLKLAKQQQSNGKRD